MKTGIYLSYIGLGANLLHLSYCHQIAKKNGPVTIITLCKNLKEALADDPLIEDVYYLDKYHKKLLDIFNLSKILKQFHFQNLLIYYPSLRLYFAAKIAGIDNIWSYKSKNKKNLHLVKSAKELTENFLNIDNCLTETNFFIDKDRIKKVKEELNNNSYKIVIGAGSSGPTTRWGSSNYANLINKLNELDNYFFLFCVVQMKKKLKMRLYLNCKNKTI